MSRSVLITGANRGIGLQMVRQSVKNGWRVYACCRQPGAADELIKVASLTPGQVSVHVLDIAETAQIQALAYELRNTPIDWLINNAGVYGSAEHQFGKTDEQNWLTTFRINTIGPMKMTEAFIDNLESGSEKKVVTLSSKMASMADNSSGGSYIYRSTKAALNAVIKSLSIDLKSRNISVVAMHPGWVKTDMGGPNAEIDTQESVVNIFNIVETSGMQDSGAFYDIDGTIIAW
ncbi:MAG: SDR family oxidoreductase [Gammaproteobacteria bacterium]|nr:SDR family oxidoreductase [Gammaproteobacteria bacterium]